MLEFGLHVVKKKEYESVSYGRLSPLVFDAAYSLEVYLPYRPPCWLVRA